MTIMTERKYKDNFTLDGRVRPTNGVSKTKVSAVRTLLEKHNAGNKIATATLHEALTTSDAIFNMAYLATLNFVPNFDDAVRNWQDVAGVRTVPDLKPATLYSLNRSWTDGTGPTQVLDSFGAAPIIPEGTAYPYAYISGDVVQGASVVKRGFKTDWTLESRINDGLGALDELPGQMSIVALDTEEADVWGALVTQKTAASNFLATTIPGPLAAGTPVPINAPLSRDAVIAAMIQLGNRRINGRRIQVRGAAFNLVVPIGQALFANYVLNASLATIQTSTTAPIQVFDYTGPDPLSSVSVIESEWVTGTQWYLIPKKGTTVRPVLERLELRGYQTPQLFVENLTGNFIGGGPVSPFEGSFDADIITLKLRQFGGGVLWDGGAAVVFSTGTGAA